MPDFLTTLRALDAAATPGPWDAHPLVTAGISDKAWIHAWPQEIRGPWTQDSRSLHAMVPCVVARGREIDAPLIMLLRNAAPRIAALIEAAIIASEYAKAHRGSPWAQSGKFTDLDTALTALESPS